MSRPFIISQQLVINSYIFVYDLQFNLQSIRNMYLFYIHVPWNIDEEDYNCSSRTHSEWQSSGSVNTIQGCYFLVVGTPFTILYVLCLYGMYRGKMLNTSCYKLMFFNGVFDICQLLLISAMTYFHFTGAVFCSSMVLGWIAGHFAYSLWLGSSFNCVVLALNRYVEMIPMANNLEFLFRGRTVYMWISLSLAYTLMAWFVFRPTPFNSTVSAFISLPMIKEYVYESVHFTSLYIIIHNCTVVVTLVTLYSIVCCYMWHARTTAGYVKHYKMFMQVLLICLSTGIATFLYVLLQFISVPKPVVILTHVLWQLSHGIHGIVYLCFNKQIRREVTRIFSKLYRTEQSTNTAVSIIKISSTSRP